jgi:hypothetical protein
MNAMICTLVLISFATFQINACKKIQILSIYMVFCVCIDDNGRDSYKRIDPDSTTAGFFPVWGVVHLILAGKLIFSYIDIYIFAN